MKRGPLAALPMLLMLGCHTIEHDTTPRRPNVILMMADDLASNDLSCFGGSRIHTPRIDQLANDGLRLTSYYAGSAVCSPSRMALLSGAYPARTTRTPLSHNRTPPSHRQPTCCPAS